MKSFHIDPSCLEQFARPREPKQNEKDLLKSLNLDSDEEEEQFKVVPLKPVVKNRSTTFYSNSSTVAETQSTSFHIPDLNQSMSGSSIGKEDIFYKTMPTTFQQFQFKNKRRFEPQVQTTQFQISLANIPGDQRTTLMIKNIPNKYTQPLLLENIDINHKDTYDFFYLPIDFTNKCNVGYAFINFLDTKFIPKFFMEFQNKKWQLFNSEKICQITYARIQGVEQLQGHFQYSTIMWEKDRRLKPIFKKQSSDQKIKRK